MPYQHILPLVAVSLAVFVSAVTDAWKFKVYNVVTVPLVLSGLVYHGVVEGGSGFAFSATGVLFGFFALLLPYVLGAIGAGDVKLMAGVGAWFGPSLAAVIFVVAAVVSAVYSCFLMARSGTLRHSFANLRVTAYQVSTLGKHLGAEEGVAVVAKTQNRRRLVPFALMIAIAVFVVTAGIRMSR